VADGGGPWSGSNLTARDYPAAGCEGGVVVAGVGGRAVMRGACAPTAVLPLPSPFPWSALGSQGGGDDGVEGRRDRGSHRRGHPVEGGEPLGQLVYEINYGTAAKVIWGSGSFAYPQWQLYPPYGINGPVVRPPPLASGDPHRSVRPFALVNGSRLYHASAEFSASRWRGCLAATSSTTLLRSSVRTG